MITGVPAAPAAGIKDCATGYSLSTKGSNSICYCGNSTTFTTVTGAAITCVAKPTALNTASIAGNFVLSGLTAKTSIKEEVICGSMTSIPATPVENDLYKLPDGTCGKVLAAEVTAKELTGCKTTYMGTIGVYDGMVKCMCAKGEVVDMRTAATAHTCISASSCTGTSNFISDLYDFGNLTLFMLPNKGCFDAPAVSYY